jgi:hypothetical protein
MYLLSGYLVCSYLIPKYWGSIRLLKCWRREVAPECRVSSASSVLTPSRTLIGPANEERGGQSALDVHPQAGTFRSIIHPEAGTFDLSTRSLQLIVLTKGGTFGPDV